MQEITKLLILWLKNETIKTGANGLIVNLKCDLESLVTAYLAKEAFQKSCYGLIFSNPEEIEQEKIALKIAEQLKIPYKKIDLDPVISDLLLQFEGNKFSNSSSLFLKSIYSRLRMISCYYFAKKFNYLVAGTLCKINILMGNFTKYGDNAGDIFPLGDMYYHQVKSTAIDLDIPDDIIELASAGKIMAAQTKDAEFGLTLNDMDNIIQCLEQKEASQSDPRLVKIIREKNRKTLHKRKMPKIFKIEVQNFDMSNERFNL